MRNSVEDLVKKGYTVTMELPDNLPKDLAEYYVYLVDNGHSVVAVTPVHAEKAKKEGHDLEDYEVPIPVDYILEKGYVIEDGVVICDFPYDSEWGVVLDEKYNTYEC